MSLSADQREAIARAIYESDRGPNDEPWAESDKVERLEYLANADAVAPLVDGWLGEARRDEQERIKAGIEALRDAASAYALAYYESGDRERSGAWSKDAATLDLALGVIEGSEATDA